MDTLARDFRLISLMTSGMGRGRSFFGRIWWGSIVIDSTFRPGRVMAGVTMGRGGPLAFSLPLALVPQVGMAFAAPLPLEADDPSSGKSSCDCVSRGALFCFFPVGWA